MPPGARSLNPFRVLQNHREFRLFWIGQTVSLIGTWMQSMAQGWLALELTDNAFLVGLVASAGSLPILLLSLHAGVLVDRYSKYRLVVLAQSLLLVEAVLLWWFTWSGNITISWLLFFALLNGILGAVEIPARQSMIVDLVGRDDLHDAIALNSSGFNLARVIGPFVAAIVMSRLGIAWCFAVNALSYLAVLGGLVAMRLPRWVPTAPRASAMEGLRELFSYMRGSPDVSMLMQLITVYSILGIPYLTLMPVFARDVLHTGPGGFGLLLACVGIGGLAGALFIASWGRRARRGELLRFASFAFPTLLVAFSVVRWEPGARVLLLLTGFMMIMHGALINGILQAMVPDAMRGRLMAVYSLIVVGLSQVVGSFAGGAVASVFGIAWAIGIGAVVMLLYAGWAYRRFPALRLL